MLLVRINGIESCFVIWCVTISYSSWMYWRAKFGLRTQLDYIFYLWKQNEIILQFSRARQAIFKDLGLSWRILLLYIYDVKMEPFEEMGIVKPKVAKWIVMEPIRKCLTSIWHIGHSFRQGKRRPEF